MSQEPIMPVAVTSPHPPRAGARPGSRKTAVTAKKDAVATKKAKVGKPSEGLSRGALAGRIAAGAAIGSAAIAGALLFAGKIDGKTPKQVWDKVNPGSRGQKRASPKKPR